MKIVNSNEILHNIKLNKTDIKGVAIIALLLIL